MYSSTLPPPPPLSTLSLHDALPISQRLTIDGDRGLGDVPPRECARTGQSTGPERGAERFLTRQSIHSVTQSVNVGGRSEEHTSELQSIRPLVCRRLLEKEHTRRCTR